MKFRTTILALSLLFCLTIAVVPSTAQQLYTNGAINGTTDAWNISNFAVSNSFPLPPMPPCCHIPNAVDFGTWMSPGDVLLSVEISITSSEFGGTTYFDQVVPVVQSGCVGNQIGFDVCTETASFSGGPSLLSGGTYWLTLQNATVGNGDPVYWDENSGPSLASENSLGTIPSESFTIYGSPSNGSTPEPSSILLFGSGAIALATLWRRKLHR